MVGAVSQFEFVWLLADVLNGLMAIPNLISLLLLSSVVVKLTKDYFAKAM
jgi:AGCS family alanine or glycine:cation symporter